MNAAPAITIAKAKDSFAHPGNPFLLWAISCLTTSWSIGFMSSFAPVEYRSSHSSGRGGVSVVRLQSASSIAYNPSSRFSERQCGLASRCVGTAPSRFQVNPTSSGSIPQSRRNPFLIKPKYFECSCHRDYCNLQSTHNSDTTKRNSDTTKRLTLFEQDCPHVYGRNGCLDDVCGSVLLTQPHYRIRTRIVCFGNQD